MKTVEIVIRLPEKTYKKLLSNEYDYGDMNVIIQTGSLLPKGHGRLIDADKLRCDARYRREDGVFVHFPAVSTSTIINAPTVIEADKDGD